MTIFIDGIFYTLPNVKLDENNNHILDKSNLLVEYLQEKTHRNTPFMIYELNGKKNTKNHKTACKHLYDFYIDNVKCDYFSVLVWNRSKSVYAILVFDKKDKIAHDIISDGLEITLNSKGKYVLKLRLNNTHLKELALKGYVLEEFTPMQWNEISLNTVSSNPNYEFNTTGDIFECYYHNRVCQNFPWIKENKPFWEECDVFDNTTFKDKTLLVQCKTQNATICTFDSLFNLTQENLDEYDFL